MMTRTISKAFLLTAVLFGLITVCQAKPNKRMDKLRTITVLHNGRYMPLDTFARQAVEDVTGTPYYRDMDPVELMFKWIVNAHYWQEQPIFPIKNADLRKHIELSPTAEYFSFNELVSHKHLHMLVDEATNKPKGEKPDALDQKVKDIESSLVVFQQIFMGTSIKLVPNPNSSQAPWASLADLVKSNNPEYASLKTSWLNLSKALKDDNGDAITEAASAFVMQVEALPAKFRPSTAQISREIHYNHFAPYTKSWILMILGSVFALASVFIKKKAMDLVTTVSMVAGFGVLTYGIYLRWAIAGRIPASNMFESLLFLSWGAALFTILGPFLFKNRVVTLTGAFIAGLSLMLGDVLPVNAYIRPVSPVLLDTFWMALHVPVIMISYSILAIAMLVAHVQVIGMGLFGSRWKYEEAADKFLYWYMFAGALLLIVGILTGSMWAADSWGRYWGWDPKEVWSLVAFLGYMAIMHIRVQKDKSPAALKWFTLVLAIAVFTVVGKYLAPLTTGKVLSLVAVAAVMVYFLYATSRFATAAKNILCFWLIIMTYVGVNYILGTGLHSYGFGAGAAARGMFLTGGIDLAILGVCLLAYYLRCVQRTDTAGPDESQSADS